MPKLLVVDDDEATRGLIRTRLSGAYEVFDTGDPEQAIGLALEHKPDAILLDLLMPKFSGFELCQSLHSLSYTSRIPIFVISGESGVKYREHCTSLGAREFFQKPIDFEALKARLTAELEAKPVERRIHVRVKMRIVLRLRGTDAAGNYFEEIATTENASAGGFLCGCKADLVKDSVVEIFMEGEHERFAGRARVVRRESAGAPWQKYGFQFQERTQEWPLQPV